MIPYMLIVVGGIMIYAGINDTNPLEVLKAVLTDSVIPKGANAPTQEEQNTSVGDPGIAVGTGATTGDILRSDPGSPTIIQTPIIRR